MWGKAYDFHRHTGRMTQDPSMRMTNKAETGFGMVGTLSLIFLAFVVLAVFL
jgi:hypothetical protein